VSGLHRLTRHSPGDHQAPRPPIIRPRRLLPKRRREVLIKGLRQRSHSDTCQSMLAAESLHSGPQLLSAHSSAVGAESSRKIRARSTAPKAEACCSSQRSSSAGSGVLDHFRRALPAPRRTATTLFHAERTNARARKSAQASDMPAQRTASTSAPPAGTSLVRRSRRPLPLESVARKTRGGAEACSLAPLPPYLGSGRRIGTGRHGRRA
jgi:hypothetical protein